MGWRPRPPGPGLLGLALAAGLLAACQSAASGGSAPDQSAALSADAAAGKQLFVSKGCVACHRAPGIPEAQGSIGPNLRGVGDESAHPKIAGAVDNTPENMQRWLLEPNKVKPGTSMPNLGLKPDEAAKLVALLETFK